MVAQGFQGLVLVEVDSVHRLACAMTQESETAEQLVLTVFAKAMGNRLEPIADRDIRLWLLRETVQAHHDLLVASGNSAAEKTCGGTAGHGPTGLKSLSSLNDRATWMRNALPAMTHRCRAVVVLWAVEGLSRHDIAEVMGEPIGTVALWLARAQNFLAKQWADIARSAATSE